MLFRSHVPRYNEITGCLGTGDCSESQIRKSSVSPETSTDGDMTTSEPETLTDNDAASGDDNSDVSITFDHQESSTSDGLLFDPHFHRELRAATILTHFHL